MDKLLNTIKKIIPTKLFKTLQPAYHFLLSWFASVVYGRPSEKMIVIGITGTTGKTTSVYMAAKVLESAGYKVGYTSTAMLGDGDKEWLNNKKMTMVGRFFTQRILARMAKNGCQYAIVETTSEGIKQFRHRFINYDTVVFTGLYPEHIESHGSFEKYKQAKGELFNHLKRCSVKYVDDNKVLQKGVGNIKKIDLNRVKKTIVANGDDENADYFLDFPAERKIVYKNTREDAKDFGENVEVVYYDDIKAGKNGIDFVYEKIDVSLSIIGEFNVQNAMNAIGVAKSQNIDDRAIAEGLHSIESIAGKLERIDEGQDFTVIVDYAFEPNAMENLYKTVKQFDYNKIIHVLGSTGGGRDADRRPKLGKLAGENAEMVVVTNEDPYEEDPNLIISQVASGAEYAGKKEGDNLFKVEDRREGIAKALQLARKNDIVLITGKGCEQAICLPGGRKESWDDREVVREELKSVKS